MRRTAALILGGGPAGSAAAITLARGGVYSELIERTEAAHDVVCGGFLGWDALAALDRLGVDAIALGARPITHLRLVSGVRQVEVELPGRAAGLSRRTLDEALLSASASAGATVMRGRSVRAADAATRTLRINDGEEVAGDALFLATGKHEVRGLGRPTARTWRGAVGMRMALRAPAASEGLDGIVELHLFDGGYAGLLLQEDGGTNLCVSVAKGRLARAGSAAALIAQLAVEAPLLRARMSNGQATAWQAIAGVPYGWRAQETVCGLFRLGDQGAVVSSLAGDGVAIALASGVHAASAFLLHGSAGAGAYQAAFARKARAPLKIADLLRRSAEARSTRPALMRLASVPGLAGVATRLTRIASGGRSRSKTVCDLASDDA